MRKVNAYKLYLLGIALIICLSALSVVAYKNIHSYCLVTQDCPQIQKANKSGEMLWDILSHQIVTLSGISR